MPVDHVKVIACNGHPGLAKAIARHLGLPLAKTSIATLPNGELIASIGESLRDQDVYICQTGFGPINDLLMELLIMISGCRSASARRITAGIQSWSDKSNDCSNPLLPVRTPGQEGQGTVSDHGQAGGQHANGGRR